MQPDSDFVNRLQSEFPDLRIRWSPKRGAFQIEQQVGRGALPPLRIDPDDDRLIRAKDGYYLVCEVRAGDKMPCPECGMTLEVPHLKFKEIKCTRCALMGKDGRVMAGYFPLNEALLQYLRRMDPLRGAIERVAKEIDEANRKLIEQRARDASNAIEAVTKETFNRVMGIASVGWTSGKNIHLSKDF